MKINSLSLLPAMMTAAALMTASCSKSGNPSPISGPEPVPGNKVDICITGDFNDFSTKAEIKNTFRLTWSAADTASVKDTVYVYGKSGAGFAVLGKLAASPVEGTRNRVADLQGIITAPEENTKLTLVYSPLEQTFDNGVVGINLEEQSGEADSVMFVAYASVDYGGKTTSSYRTSFSFATNVIRVNVSGLEAGKLVLNALIDSIETVCQLTLNENAAPTIGGAVKDTIIRKLSSLRSNDKGSAAFYVAVPVFTADAGRELDVSIQTSTKASINREVPTRMYRYPAFATGEQATGGKALNSIAAIPTPIEYKGGTFNYGCGTFIPETGVIWAPVNCGCSDSTKYGLLYQFGRKVGSGYNTGEAPFDTEPKQTPTASIYLENGYNKHPDDTCYYTFGALTTDWYTNTNDHLQKWPMEDPGGTTGIGNPCPEGWRIPTYKELAGLLGGKEEIDNFTEKAAKDGQLGYWLDGTGKADRSSGVFFPFSGRINNGNPEYRDDGNNKSLSGANYWSSTTPGGNSTYVLSVVYGSGNGAFFAGWYNRCYGCSVRCVQK